MSGSVSVMPVSQRLEEKRWISWGLGSDAKGSMR